MTQPLLRHAPTSSLVARAWLRSVLPAQVGVDRKLPEQPTADMRSHGFVVLTGVGGSPDPDVPMRAPVLGLRCWVAPTEKLDQQQWGAAERLAGWVLTATYEHPVTGLRLDLAAFGAYRPARVHTVVPLSEPREAPDDPGKYAAVDLDLHLFWTEQ